MSLDKHKFIKQLPTPKKVRNLKAHLDYVEYIFLICFDFLLSYIVCKRITQVWT